MSSIIWKAHLTPSAEVERYSAIAEQQWPGPPSEPIDPCRWRTSFATIIGTDENGVVVGGCHWVRRSIKVESTEIEIAALGAVVMAPEFRGQGIGGELIQFADEWVAGQGYDWSVLFTSPERVRFYSAAGYSKLEGTVYVTNWGKLETIEPQTMVMAKPLRVGVEPKLASWLHATIDVGHGQW